MTEKNYIVRCIHDEDDRECLHKEVCAIHCHNNKNGKCNRHCDKTWACETEAQANILKTTHTANERLHKPHIKKM